MIVKPTKDIPAMTTSHSAGSITNDASNRESNAVATRLIGLIDSTRPSYSAEHHHPVQAAKLDTPLGGMLAIANERGLYLLAFFEQKMAQKSIEHPIKRPQQETKAVVSWGDNAIIQQISRELNAYFAGHLRVFQTPIHLLGTPFQQAVWRMLQSIPCGTTQSYQQQAIALGKPTAYRAVANANAANQLAIIVPCHRIIRGDGCLGGYAGGQAKKQALLQHERAIPIA